MSSPLTKHKLDGIGEASAVMVMASLSVNPSTQFLTVGPSGKIIFFLMTRVFAALASIGIVMLNVGADRLLTAVDKVGFDGSWGTAEKMMREIQKTGRELTPAEIKKIDDGVIESFRKFAKLGRKKK